MKGWKLPLAFGVTCNSIHVAQLPLKMFDTLLHVHGRKGLALQRKRFTWSFAGDLVGPSGQWVLFEKFHVKQ